jgi:amino acid adenylation domain-containing protein
MKTLDKLLSDLRQRDVQLWLEGERLRYRAAKDSLTPELLAELKTQKSEIIKFLRQITTVVNSPIPPITVCERNGNLPLSFGQQRLWFLHQFEPDSSAYNMPIVVRLTGNLNVAVLEESIKEVARRHELLRTTFPAVNGKPTQVIASDVSLNLPVIDLQHVPDEQREAEAHRLATHEAHRPFDLANGPILRAMLLRLSEREHLLIWNMHTIVCDGSSADLFYQNLITIYQALSLGKPSPLPALPVQYADFAHWQHQWLQGEVLESQVNYWKQKLEGNLPIIQLPYDRPRPQGVHTYRGERAALLLSKALNNALTNLSQKWGVTLFMTLLTAFETLLYRYSGQENLLINFASVGRGQVETEGLIGFFSNTLILRSDLAGNPTFREFLNRVRHDCLEAYTHQDLPFEKLIEELSPQQCNRNSSPLFQVKFSLNPPWSNGRGMASVQLPDLTITALFGYIYHGKTKYDLTLVLREQDNGLGMVFDYNADMFEASTIERMLGHFQNLLEGIVANPDCPILELPLLTKSEEHQLLVEWNQTQVADIQHTCIHQLFEAQVERTPDQMAVVWENEQLTYQQLNKRANQLADYLQTLGVGAGVFVGLYLEPSVEMIIGLLAISKAGGTYVPITPTCQRESLAFILEEAQVSLLLTQRSLIEQLPKPEASIICLDSDWEAMTYAWSETIALHDQHNPVTQTTSENIACVMYLPQTTGKPKAIAISYDNIVNHAVAMNQLWDLTAGDRVLISSGMNNETIIESLFPCWVTGASAVVQPQISDFFSFITKQQITVLNLPTFFWYRIVDQLSESQPILPKSLRLVMVGGEKVSASAYQTWVERVGTQISWLNAYGAKETTLTTTVYYPEKTTTHHTEIPIGKPIANNQIYILDRLLQPVAIGSPGEIYIGGIGVTKGYFKRPDLTSERFIANPFSDDPNALLYKTGDLARYLPDRNIEYLGRIDKQVKICGFSADLEQIEALLNQHQAIAQALVIAHEVTSSNKQLVAYIVPQPGQTPTNDDLQVFLSQKVPHYLLPLDFIRLESLPVNPNGQVNHTALPKPDVIKQKSAATFVAPRNQIEKRLTKIWQELLGIEQIGIEDNFFALGGNSLMAVRLFTEIEKTYAKHLPLSILLQKPTIAEMAQIFEQQKSPSEWPSLVMIQPGVTSKTPLFCIHGIWGNVLFYRKLARYLDPQQPFYALPAQGLDGQQAPLTSLSEMASRYVQEIQKVQSKGPYLLGGFSLGGLLALEVAQQLQTQGHEVKLLAIFDTVAPQVRQFSDHANPQKPDHLWKKSWLHVKKLLHLPLKEKVSYLWETMYWHLKAGKMSIFYQLYLRYIKRSLPELHIIKVANASHQAYKIYSAEIYPGKVTLFRAANTVTESETDPTLRWCNLATDGVDIYEVPGTTHTNIMEEPYVQLLAKQLQGCLERLSANNTLIVNKLPVIPLSEALEGGDVNESNSPTSFHCAKNVPEG